MKITSDATRRAIVDLPPELRRRHRSPVGELLLQRPKLVSFMRQHADDRLVALQHRLPNEHRNLLRLRVHETLPSDRLMRPNPAIRGISPLGNQPRLGRELVVDESNLSLPRKF